MNYDLLISGFQNEKAKIFATRFLTQEWSIPYQRALSLLDNLPVAVCKNAPEHEISLKRQKLQAMGIETLTLESILDPPKIKHDTVPSKSISIHPIQKHRESTLNTLNHSTHSEFSKVDKTLPPFNKANNFSAKTFSRKKFFTIIFVLSISLIPFAFFTLLNHVKSTESESDIIEKEESLKNLSTDSVLIARSFIDSALLIPNDYERAVKFYTFAIAFNKHNFNAWNGLLETYIKAGNLKAEARTLHAMKELFGNDFGSIKMAIRQCGKIVELYRDHNDIYRIEYLSKKNGKEALLNEIYTITKVIQPACMCKRFSVFAATSPGHGLIMHFDATINLSSRDKFIQSSDMMYLP